MFRKQKFSEIRNDFCKMRTGRAPSHPHQVVLRDIETIFSERLRDYKEIQ